MSASVQPRLSGRLFSAAAFLLLVVQVALAFIPVIDAKQGRSAAAHVESGSTAKHYAHNEETCATCQARTLHGIALRAAPALVDRALHIGTVGARAHRVVAVECFSPSAPRAPPIVV